MTSKIKEDRGKHLNFVQSHLTTLTSIINKDELIRSLCLEKNIITLDEYNGLAPDWTRALFMLLLNKGEKACQKFVCQVLKNQKVKETFPRLEELDWTLLRVRPEMRVRPERRVRPGIGGHGAPGSSVMENDFTTPEGPHSTQRSNQTRATSKRKIPNTAAPTKSKKIKTAAKSKGAKTKATPKSKGAKPKAPAKIKARKPKAAPKS